MSNFLPRFLLVAFATLAFSVVVLPPVGVCAGEEKAVSKKNQAPAKNGAEKCEPVALDKAKAVTPDVVGAKNIAVNVSPDKLAQTIKFDNLRADYGPEQAAMKFTPVKAAFLEIPISAGVNPNCDLLGYSVDIWGHVNVTAGARAHLTFLLGGEAQQLEFPFDNAWNDDFHKRIFFLSRSTGKPGATVVRSPLHIQLILTVETAESGDEASLTVDSLDLEARKARQSLSE